MKKRGEKRPEVCLQKTSYRLGKEIKLNYLHSKHRNADEANTGQDENT